jgi:hypothetical protein
MLDLSKSIKKEVSVWPLTTLILVLEDVLSLLLKALKTLKCNPFLDTK